MTDRQPLKPEQLYQACEPESLPFRTTTELEDLHGALGQQRALDALEFGVDVRHEGYNLYVMGSPGLGKHFAVSTVLEQRASAAAVPPDWCYVNNFRFPQKPRALTVPAGIGTQLQGDLRRFVRELLIVLPAAFDTDEYRARVQELSDEFKAKEDALFATVAEEATKVRILVVRTPAGYTIVPMKGEEAMEPAEFEQLPEDQKQVIRDASEKVHQSLRQAMQQSAALHREHAKRMDKLNEDVARHQVDLRFNELLLHYESIPAIPPFLTEVRQDILESTDEFRKFAAENKLPTDGQRLTPFNRYYVNVLIDNGPQKGAPVVHEDNPTYQNLIGSIEHLAHFGTLITDFMLIKGGALHRANGGYLVLDARKLLTTPFAWDALKRALNARELRIQSLEQMLSLASTISLEPEPIPLDVKVILSGDRLLYYLLSAYDPEFPLLFKVEADFSEDMPRSSENSLLYARLIATMQRREKLLPVSSAGVARIIEQAARRADDSEKLTLDIGGILDLMRESDHHARKSASTEIDAGHVERAVASSIHRTDQLRERAQESVLRGFRLIDTTGSAVGQINALAVFALGKHAFGQPTRISATTRLGDGQVLDIERAVKLGQPVHSKGVMILSAFLAQRFGQKQPLSLNAAIVFEQSYGPVDGDSASAAELCALLSSLSGLPLRQDLAITGSVNQHGAMQAIGGVNEKIEGFFDICRARGLSGSQGVIIPLSNIAHLMLRQDVIESVRAGQFYIYAVATVDEAVELLTGVATGVMDDRGNYPDNSVNARVVRQIAEWANLRRQFAASGKQDSDRERPG